MQVTKEEVEESKKLFEDDFDLVRDEIKPEPEEPTLAGEVDLKPRKFLVYNDEDLYDVNGQEPPAPEPVATETPDEGPISEEPAPQPVSSMISSEPAPQPEPGPAEISALPKAQATAVSDSVVFCPNCGARLRVQQAGKYLCPSCRTKFQYPFTA